MAALTASEARATLCRLIDQTAESHEPVVIAGKRSSAVLVAEEDWQAIQETSHLLSVPGMHESIKKGMAETLRKCNVVRQISEWFLVTSSRSAISPACETRSRSTPKRSSRSA